MKTLPNQTESESAEAATANTVYCTSIEKRRAERSATLCMTNLPASVRNMVSDVDWPQGDFALNEFDYLLEQHAKRDNRSGCTASYFLSSDRQRMTDRELADMVSDGVIHDDFHNGKTGVNQHFLHSIEQVLGLVCSAWICHKEEKMSIEQFVRDVNSEWFAHGRRTALLIGTPAGCIRRPKNRRAT